MVNIADGKPFKMPATIDDPAILDEIKDAPQTIGLNRPGFTGEGLVQ